MQMNHYLWSLYLNSGGQTVVDRFSAFESGNRAEFSAFALSLILAYCPDVTLAHNFAKDIDDAVLCLDAPDAEDINENLSVTPSDNRQDTGRTYADEADIDWKLFQKCWMEESPLPPTDRQIFEVFCESIVYWSVLNYADGSDAFIPYFFPCLYNVLTSIAKLFEIELPETPSRRNYKGRFLLYYALCSTFTQFRKEQGWSSAELCAFLYDFAPKFAGGTNWIWQTLPEPRAAFVIGAPPDATPLFQNTNEGNFLSWQGNPDTQPGDIILLYQWAPISAFTSVWRAVTPGFIDPFFWYYRCIYIGNPVSIPALSFQTLKSHPVLGQIGLVKAHMQGMDGTELKPSQYNLIRDLLCDIREVSLPIPRLNNHLDYVCPDFEIKTERDVEINLLEPLLKRLGWFREHYIRQMPLRMGRGSTVYPDYAILP